MATRAAAFAFRGTARCTAVALATGVFLACDSPGGRETEDAERALAPEVGDAHICVNAITPGFTASESQLAGSTPEHLQRMDAANSSKCLKRTQVPEDLVGAVVFLLSSASNHVTGQTINVDGGQMMH